MNVRRSTMPAKATIRSIISAIVILVGILLLAMGFWGGTTLLIYLGLTLVLIGVIAELVFGVLGLHLKSWSTRGHI